MSLSFPHVTLICITATHEQVVCHGYRNFYQAESEIAERVRLTRDHGHSTRYRRFIIIGTVDEVDGLHVYDNNGHKTHDQFI